MLKYLDNMIINYYGEQFFKVSFGDFVMALNPTNQKGGTKFGSELVSQRDHRGPNFPQELFGVLYNSQLRIYALQQH